MLFEALKSVIKLIFFSTIVYVFLASALPSIAALTNADPGGVAHWLAENALSLLFRLGLGLLVVGILDLAYVRWSFNKQMMMSRREVKEEVKRREGDPQIRAKIRELQRENLKQARSMGNLPDADVLITNPTHFAVALKYDRATMDAPVVLAKGSDEWVVEMKAIARQRNIPILERKKLARALFKHGLIDQAIPPDSFIEVARVYAELNTWKRRRTGDDARYEVRV
jgi:flagellar biosynthesis protein FlhB